MMCLVIPTHTFKTSLSLNLRDAKTLHCAVLALQLLTLSQVPKDVTHLYHLDLFHVACGSLPCVNQNCEGAT